MPPRVDPFEGFTDATPPPPRYLALLESGELARRVEQGLDELASCQVCPRDCGVDRLHATKPDSPSDGSGPSSETRPTRRIVPDHIPPGTACFTGRHARVASSHPHFGEEDCLRGTRGSGTVFFSFCNLRCVFCQNWDISQLGGGIELDAQQLAGRMLDLQRQGCHNINWVTPEHVVPQALEALWVAAERGLRLPIVYNTSAYDSLGSLQLLDGVVDLYMPDFKVWDTATAKRQLKAADYVEVARGTVAEMHRQVGPLRVGPDGMATTGVLVRHLVMPEAHQEARHIFRFLAGEVSTDTYVNVMGQYYPAGSIPHPKHPALDRHVHTTEVGAALEAAGEEGLWRFDHRR
jgi:putative pyruvate formate lyase activating enzyme